jgi:Ca-activated chloride channel family protein
MPTFDSSIRGMMAVIVSGSLLSAGGCSEEAEDREAGKVDSATAAAPEASRHSEMAKTEDMTIAGATAAAPAGSAQLDRSSTAPAPQTREAPKSEPNAEDYGRIVDNAFRRVVQDPLSTFAIDVDTASYANVRRFLGRGMMPPKDAVRLEELINYFTYSYPPPQGDDPFSVNIEVDRCPWNPEHRLACIGLKGKDLKKGERPATNLVFLLDVSGSMDRPEKLPLLKSALKMMVERLGENDRVGIVVYAAASGVVLPSTTCDRKAEILAALEGLHAAGSTNGGSGIQSAYDMAVANFIQGGVNRVILATDGDFNVGVTDRGELTRLIESKAKSGVYLTVLGFGMGNYKDSTLETIADKGNGNHAYIDSIQEARKVLVEQLGGTLVTIAKDVKVQIEFNPARVGAYRLIGYEDRMLRSQDFHDDTKDAGEIGAGHTVTALYELVPPGKESDIPGVDALKYQSAPSLSPAAKVSDELLTVKLRYKEPDGQRSKLLEGSAPDLPGETAPVSDDFRFAAAVAEFGMLLRDSPYKGNATFGGVLELAESSQGPDKSGYRREFLELVRRTQELQPR